MTRRNPTGSLISVVMSLRITSYNVCYTKLLRELLFLFAFIVGMGLLLQIVRRAIYRSKRIDFAKKYSIYSLLKYIILVFASLASLQILGFNLSVLLAGSAALLVGLGLGLQNLFSDFISGIILLVDASIKVDDIIEVVITSYSIHYTKLYDHT